ncbi:cytochrome c oxidase subunit II [Natrinema gelatinilyticum]|uniref:cytochrome c oxidase subunit II n=1 Tax=Natrinema gelatinilyticum TaxID=2961571 RepID=UPI0020C4F8EF|nr:cytochrome c oxidase subunit II [Natrinema gelatinilyticum]
MNTIYSAFTTPLQQARTRVDVFQEIFLVFLALGTLVGIVVVAYTLYNAYKYRDTDENDADENLPSVGELPTGGKGGKKLFLSFGISAIIVISLVVWTYSMLLYVEDPGQQQGQEEALNVEVTGEGFAWFFEYDTGIETTSTLRVPADERIWLNVTSGDVWHAFGIPDQRVKADAIPGEYDRTWFEAEDAGATHEIQCFELCGEFHTSMTGTVQVMEPEAFDEWMNSQLTMSYTVQDANETPVTEGYELTVEHQERDFEQTYSADQFENGTIEITEIEYGGPYNATLTSTDGQFEPITKEIDMTGPVDETFTLEGMNATDSNTNGNETQSNGNETQSNDGGGN